MTPVSSFSQSCGHAHALVHTHFAVRTCVGTYTLRCTEVKLLSGLHQRQYYMCTWAITSILKARSNLLVDFPGILCHYQNVQELFFAACLIIDGRYFGHTCYNTYTLSYFLAVYNLSTVTSAFFHASSFLFTHSHIQISVTRYSRLYGCIGRFTRDLGKISAVFFIGENVFQPFSLSLISGSPFQASRLQNRAYTVWYNKMKLNKY